jgi:hypothetical protein
MTTTLGGPREGTCTVKSWLRHPDPDDRPYADHLADNTDHGTMTWADFLDTMTIAGASRPTYDLFDVEQANGLIRRYRVCTVGECR